MTKAPLLFVLLVAVTVYNGSAAPQRTKGQVKETEQCSQCRPGYRVIKPCTWGEDTVCLQCHKGYFSPSFSSKQTCKPCSKCGEGLFELHKCHLKRDVFCGSCSKHRHKANSDYIKKCINIPGKNEVKFNHHLNEVMLGDQPMNELNQVDSDETKDTKDAKETSYNELQDDIPKTEKQESQLKSGDDIIHDTENDVTSDVENKQTDMASENNMDVGKPVISDTIAELSKKEASTMNMKVQKHITHEQENKDLDEETTKAGMIIMPDEDTEYMFDSIIGDKEYQTTKSNIVELVNKHMVQSKAPTLKEDWIKGEEYDGSGEEDSLPLHTTTKYRNEPDEEMSSGDIGIHKDSEVSTLSSSLPIEVTHDGGLLESFAIDQTGADTEEKDKIPIVGASSEKGGVQAAAIIIMVLTSGLIFFLIGFYLHRHNGKKIQMYSPSKFKNSYQLTPMKEDEDFEIRKGPEITLTSCELNGSPLEERSVLLQSTPKPSTPKPPLAEDTGKFRSPIDIIPETAVFDEDMANRQLSMTYVPENTKSLINTGDGIKVNIDCRGSDLHGGPLDGDRYYLDHFTFNWGSDNNNGSRHRVSGACYAAELHLVHWNKEHFKNFIEASRYDDGLCIIVVFVEVTNEEHTGLQPLLDVFNSIQYKGESCEVPHHFFDPGSLLPANTDHYWCYPGSLTIPPYKESVQWIIMKNRMKVSKRQIEMFRNLNSQRKGLVSLTLDEDNSNNNENKSTFDLGNRVLRASFR